MIYLALLFSLWFVTPVFSHPGPLDAYGCHGDPTLFGAGSPKRECHQGPLAGQVFSSTTTEYQAYIAAQTGQLVDLKAKLDACLARCPVVSVQADVKLTWLPNADTDLAGYLAYCGTTSKAYTMKQNVGNVVTYTFPKLPGGMTYYCAVTAYDKSLNESPFSQEVTKVLP